MSSDADSVGVQCAVEGVNTAGAASATTVHRQWVRVGAAVIDVERRNVLAKSEMVDALTSILCDLCDLC